MYDIYHPDQNNLWRYTLGRSGSKPLLVIGLNPSTATPEKLDPTVTRVEKVAQQSGFDGFVMLNLYPVRATDPKDLSPKADPEAYQRTWKKSRRSSPNTPTPPSGLPGVRPWWIVPICSGPVTLCMNGWCSTSRSGGGSVI